MRELMSLPCAALLVAAAPATTSPPAISSQVVQSDQQQPSTLGGGAAVPALQDKKICKQLETSGSRLPRRACLTQQEWKQLEAELNQ